jgi:hypothetical protein
MPLSVTAYWFFGPDGEPIPWNGQADGSPEAYANMQPTSPDHAQKVGACIQDWTLFYWTTAVSFVWQGQELQVACYDNFGLESYRQPFYHDGYGVWVVPVDVLSPYPMHDLVWDWHTDMVRVEEID